MLPGDKGEKDKVVGEEAAEREEEEEDTAITALPQLMLDDKDLRLRFKTHLPSGHLKKLERQRRAAHVVGHGRSGRRGSVAGRVSVSAGNDGVNGVDEGGDTCEAVVEGSGSLADADLGGGARDGAATPNRCVCVCVLVCVLVCVYWLCYLRL